MKKYFYLLISVLLPLFIGCGSGSNANRADTYSADINRFRFEKNLFFKNDIKSPLPPELKERFDSLDYFPVNTGFRIIAEFLPIAGGSTMSLPLNNGKSRVYIRHGFATFTKDNVTSSLLVLRSASGQSNELFVPFHDKTNGLETYGGGRYLEPTQIGENKIVLDFNRAYNPFCAYSPEYICPLPPKENILKIEVEAGEKTFEMH